eukprot:COSAG01_NODE_7648_length_3115_cov_1.548077_3_plen_92_part_00
MRGARPRERPPMWPPAARAGRIRGQPASQRGGRQIGGGARRAAGGSELASAAIEQQRAGVQVHSTLVHSARPSRPGSVLYSYVEYSTTVPY